ncbi:MAG: hypothetical protein HYU30_09770 [Chloroflexi bacterium]|nr:hypothetical protein [Chloroflexota bacterium]
MANNTEPRKMGKKGNGLPMARRDGAGRCWKLVCLQGLWGLVIAAACNGAPEEPVQEVNAPSDFMVTSTPFDPLHAPREGSAPPEVVVEIDLENRYDFDLLPRRVNGALVRFNGDHKDNGEEPLKLPPGKVRFVLTNTGTISHNFRLMGRTPEGVTFDVTTPAVDRFMGAGVMWEMEARLWEGEYLMICNVTNHDARGMSRPLIVTREASYPAPPLR